MRFVFHKCPSQPVLILGLLCLFTLLFCLFWPISVPQSTIIQQQTHHKLLQSLELALGNRTWAQLSRLNCSKLLEADANYVQKVRRQRIVQRDPDDLNMDCHAIQTRWNFLKEPRSQEEAKFPLAFARTVFKDYLFLEQMLSVEYAPQNSYCYSLDAKADKKFKERIRALSSCFPNVFVSEKEYIISSNGKNVSRSHLACLNELNQQGAKWKYVFLLQNHDIPLRTNAEFAKILRIFNGTNDISTRPIMAVSVNRSLNWSIQFLRLYRNESQITSKLDQLRHTKSLNLIALSRAAVAFTLENLNLGPFIDQLEKSRYGMDEVLFSTLNSNLPDFPGGFTTDCLLNQNRSVQSMGRYTIWRNYGTETGRCKSNHFRHDLCVYGVEDLSHISTARLHFYLNKMMPSFDFGALYCWLNGLATRRQSERSANINERFYQNLPHVRYNHLRIHGQLERFKC